MTGKPLVGVVLGSTSDLERMDPCLEKLREMEVPFEMRVLSAHRTPDACADFAREAAGAGFRVLIAAAGMAAHLPGVVAAHTPLPVIGVALGGPLGNREALYSVVRMPGGVPVACVAVGSAGPVNAALLATQILGAGDPTYQARIVAMKSDLEAQGRANDARVKEEKSWTP